MQHKYLFKKYFVPSLLFFTGLVVGFFFLFYVNATFRIKHIEVSGVTHNERTVLLSLFRGTSTLMGTPPEINKIIHSRFPTMNIRKSHIAYPNTLVLVVEKEKAFAYLKTDSGYVALSKNGTIVRKERGVTIPYPALSFYQIIHHSEYQTGQHIGFAAVKRALQFLAVLADEGYQTETVAIDSVDMIACKTKGFEVAFSQTRPIDLQVHEVRQIIRQVKAGALRIGRLDLRFDKPVVQLPQK